MGCFNEREFIREEFRENGFMRDFCEERRVERFDRFDRDDRDDRFDGCCGRRRRCCGICSIFNGGCCRGRRRGCF